MNKPTTAALALTLLLSTPTHAGACRYPEFLQSLPELRRARAILQHQPGDEAAQQDENAAIHEIDTIIAELNAIPVDDGHAITIHGPLTLPPEHPARLQLAIKPLRTVETLLAREDADNLGKREKARLLNHIRESIQHTQLAIAALK